MMAINKVMLWAVTLMAVVFLLFPHSVRFFLAGRGVENNTLTASPFVTTTTIAIDGMTCEGCSIALETSLRGVPGVLNATVDFPRARAMVSTEACCPLFRDAILEAVENAGFSANVVDSK